MLGIDHLRKRIYKKHEKYPHPDKKKRFIDNFIYIAAIVGPLFTLPQVIEIWKTQSAGSVSIFTWVLFTTVSLTWMYYGYVHKEKPIMISNGLWTFMYLLVIISALIFN